MKNDENKDIVADVAKSRLFSLFRKEKATFLLLFFLFFMILAYVFLLVYDEHINFFENAEQEVSFGDFFGQDVGKTELNCICAGFINVNFGIKEKNKEKKLVENAIKRSKKEKLSSEYLIEYYNKGRRMTRILKSYQDYKAIEIIEKKCQDVFDEISLGKMERKI
jgi:hypothetical protein